MKKEKKAPEDRAEIGVAVVACGSARKKKITYSRYMLRHRR